MQPLLVGTTPADFELEAVVESVLRDDPDGTRFARAIRRSFDMLLDGQHTGRFRWDQLYKTEKTHAGTLIEINLQREFGFSDGAGLDYMIAGTDVDCKYSQSMTGWMIPPEAVDKLLLVISANDQAGTWSAGVVRARSEWLNAGANRDAKKTLGKSGRQAIHWLFSEAPLKDNLLLRLPGPDIEAIFASWSGQQRLNELFRRAQCRIVSRMVVATVAQQEDYMKRVRYNRGSRSALQPEGIVILGDYKNHGAVASQLGLTVPGDGESLSVRLARRQAHHGDAPYCELNGEAWVIARETDPVEAVPILPETKK